jgi:hypothetical protein
MPICEKGGSESYPATFLPPVYISEISKVFDRISKRFYFNVGVHVFGGDDISMVKQILRLKMSILSGYLMRTDLLTTSTGYEDF